MPKTYTTKQGDTWDVISLLNYGTELMTATLVEANHAHRAVGIFSAGVVLAIPPAAVADEYAANLPPWRRA